MASIPNEQHWPRCAQCHVAPVFPLYCRKCKRDYCAAHYDGHECEAREKKSAET